MTLRIQKAGPHPGAGRVPGLRPRSPRAGSLGQPAILVLTARMGAGHDGVAGEVEGRLRALGARTRIIDVWDLQPAGLGRLVTVFYRSIIRVAPWMYAAIYRGWLRPPPGHRRAPLRPATWWAERSLLREVRRERACAVVTTFHLGTQLLGGLRARGALDIPTVSYCVDFAAHGLWVSSGVDANLCLHEMQGRRLASQGARGVSVAGTIVGARFRPDPVRREAARRNLGVGADERVVLVLSGSWGSGRVDETLAALERLDGFRAVVATGTNERLRQRLGRRFPEAITLGWIDDMSKVIRAADAVVENAGGLSAMEAMACGVPVVSYLPIPGHGRENVTVMTEAGISAYARDEGELGRLLTELSTDSPRRRRLLAAAGSMAARDPMPTLLAAIQQRSWAAVGGRSEAWG